MEHRFLGEICCPKQWKTISTSELTETGYPVYGANGIIGKYKEYNHENATILVTCRGATCGSVVISKPYSYVNGNAMALDNLDDDICIDYLYFYLIGRGFADVISGSAQPQIIRSTIEKIRIPLCNFEKQKQIASVFSTINGMKLKFELLIEKYDQLVKARFVEMFGDIDDKNCWPRNKWEVVVTIKNGKDYKKHLVKEGGYPVYGTGGEMCRVSEFLCPENTVIVGRKGSINNPLLVKEKFWNVDTAFGVIPDKKVLHYLYFYEFCRKFDFMKLNKATTLPSTTKADLLQIEINIPPIDLQNQFADFVKQVDKSKFIQMNSTI